MFRYFLFAGKMVFIEIQSCIYNTNIIAAVICFSLFLSVIMLFDYFIYHRVFIIFSVWASIYLTFLMALTILGRPTGQVSGFDTLFISYERLVNGGRWGFFPTLLNILMFIPFGFIVSRYYKKTKLSILALLILPILIESIQLITSRGVFEISDILNNLIGGLIGLGVLRLIAFIKRQKESE